MHANGYSNLNMDWYKWSGAYIRVKDREELGITIHLRFGMAVFRLMPEPLYDGKLILIVIGAAADANRRAEF